jgi:IS30 family transposase
LLKHVSVWLQGGRDGADAGHKQAIVKLVERKSGFAVRYHVTRKTSNLFKQAITASIASLAKRVRKVTYDNDKEFSDHAVVDWSLKLTTYFADLFALWQRSSNENFNILLPQYIKKKDPHRT